MVDVFATERTERSTVIDVISVERPERQTVMDAFAVETDSGRFERCVASRAGSCGGDGGGRVALFRADSRGTACL